MKFAPKLLATAFAIAAATSVSAQVINFDNLTGGPIGGGDVVTNQYAGLGVTFLDTYAGGAHANNTLGAFIPGSSSPNVLWTDQGGGASTGQYLQISFASAVGNVSALFGTSLGADITMAAYSGATLLDSVTLIGSIITGDVRSGLIGLTDTGITSVRLYSHSGNSSFNFSIDNLNWQAAAVPEPSTYAMLFAGLGVVGWATRRRQHAAR
ncbi:MAG: PEP-CTERM sorting domain-containing protein [Burkholderiales bacterium]